MKNWFIVFTSIILLESSCPSSFGQASAHTILERSCQFLWEQQSVDGGWHSKKHNLLRGGVSLSAYLLYTLLQVPEWVYEADKEQVQKAVNFIRNQINEQGVIGSKDSTVLDRPNYSTAYALLILKEFGTKKDSVLIHQMTTYLKQQQFTAQRGFDIKHYAYGSWGFGETNLPKGKTGLVDLSHTRRILIALQEVDDFEAIAYNANYFFRLTQKHWKETRLHPTGISPKNIPYDGGFFESPVTLSSNKAGIETDTSGAPHFFRSYATATCDGILGLLAIGATADHAAIQDAFQWLQRHPKWSYPQGIPIDHPEQWQEVLFYYHLAVRAEVYALLDKDGTWQKEVVSLLQRRQNKNGGFKNDLGDKGMEDDILVGTGLAISALVAVLE